MECRSGWVVDAIQEHRSVTKLLISFEVLNMASARVSRCFLFGQSTNGEPTTATAVRFSPEHAGQKQSDLVHVAL